MELDKKWRPKVNGDYKDITSTDNRKSLMRVTGVTKSNLVNYLHTFYEKSLLIKNDNGGTEINPFFMVEPVNGVLEINIILECHEEKMEEKKI